MIAALYTCANDQGFAQSSQEHLCKLQFLAQQLGCTSTRKYADLSTCQAQKRPQFKQLLHDASRLCFDVVLFWDLQHFSCEPVATLVYLQQLSAVGIRFKSFREESVDTTNWAHNNLVEFLQAVRDGAPSPAAGSVRLPLPQARPARQLALPANRQALPAQQPCSPSAASNGRPTLAKKQAARFPAEMVQLISLQISQGLPLARIAYQFNIATSEVKKLVRTATKKT